MEWQEFLTKLANEYIKNLKDLDPKAPNESTVRKTFIESFPAYQDVLENPFKDVKAKAAHQTLIYRCFESDCTELVKRTRDKWEVLRDWLNDKFASLSSPQKKDRFRANEPLPSIPVWHGRELLLTQLEEFLKESTLRVLVLLGQGGIGKTSLAIKLMEKIAPQYKQVFYFRVREGTSFNDFVALVLGQEALAGETVEAKILEMLRCFQQTTLLILDNLEDGLHPAHSKNLGKAIDPEFGVLINRLAFTQHQAKVMITSRELPLDLADPRTKRTNPKLVRVHIVDGISQESSLVILQEYGFSDKRLADLETIAKRTGGHPLMMELLSNYVEQLDYLLKHPEIFAEGAISILQDQLLRQPESARELLFRMTLLRHPVDVSGLNFLRIYDDRWEKDGRYQQALMLAQSQQTLEFSESVERETEQILRLLTQSNLVKRTYDEWKNEFFYSLHPVIILGVQIVSIVDNLPRLFQQVYRYYQSDRSFQSFDFQRDTKCIEETMIFVWLSGDQKEAVSLLQILFNYSIRSGQGSLLESALSQAASINSNFKQSDVLLIMAQFHGDIGDWKKAEAYCHQSLSIAEALDDRIGMASSWSLLGDIENFRGDYDAAEQYKRQSFALRQECDDRKGMATSLGRLGVIKRNRGDLDAAESLYRQSLQLFTELGHCAGIAMVSFDLALLEKQRGNLTLAQQYYDKAKTIYQQLGAIKDLEPIEKEWNLID
jgi:tetratricopeptide (TPR) repeat protein